MSHDVLDKPGAEGWYQIRVDYEEDDPEKPEPGERFKLSIMEMPSRKYYQDQGPSPWPPMSTSENFFEPVAQDFDGRTLTVDIQPDITGTFESQMYVFSIKGETSGFKKTINKNISALKRPRETTGRPVPPQPAQPEQPPSDPQAGPAPESAPPESAPSAAPVSPPVDNTAADPPPARKKSKPGFLLGLIGALILILALALAGFWFWKRTPAPDSPPASDSSGPSAPAADMPGPQSSKSPLDEVRELIRQEAGPAEMDRALARLEKQPGSEDAVFLLVKFLAAREAKYRLRYAAFMDPTDLRPTGTIKKDPLAACEEYEAAKAEGAPEAERALERLRHWAEEAANQGDPGAKRVLELEGGAKP